MPVWFGDYGPCFIDFIIMEITVKLTEIEVITVFGIDTNNGPYSVCNEIINHFSRQFKLKGTEIRCSFQNTSIRQFDLYEVSMYLSKIK